MMTLKIVPISAFLNRCLQTPFPAPFKALGFLQNLTISQMSHMESLYSTKIRIKHVLSNALTSAWPLGKLGFQRLPLQMSMHRQPCLILMIKLGPRLTASVHLLVITWDARLVK